MLNILLHVFQKVFVVMTNNLSKFSVQNSFEKFDDIMLKHSNDSDINGVNASEILIHEV